MASEIKRRPEKLGRQCYCGQQVMMIMQSGHADGRWLYVLVIICDL